MYSWAPAGIFAGGGASPKKAPLKMKKAPPQKKSKIVLSPFLGGSEACSPEKILTMVLLRHFRCISAGAYLGFHFGGGGGCQINFGKCGVFTWREAFARGDRGHAHPRKF